MKEFLNVFTMIWETFGTFMTATIVLAAGLKSYELFMKHFKRQNEREEDRRAREWRKLDKQLRDQAILRQQAAEASRLASYPWNSNKPQLHSTCPSCGQVTSWPYVGTCICGTKIEEPKS
jgi:hypothetical protein